MNEEERPTGADPAMGRDETPAPDAAAVHGKPRKSGAAPKGRVALKPNVSRIEELTEELIFDEPVQKLIYSRTGASSEDSEIVRPDKPAIETERILNNLIEECHFLMREVAFRSMCQTHDSNHRIHFMHSAMDFAKTGAEVANAIVRLRGGAITSQTHHHVSVEHVRAKPPAEPGEGEG